MGVTTALTAGLAQLIADGTGWKWRPDGPAYATEEIGIAVATMPASPDRMVVLTVYSALDDPSQADSVRRLQIRTRGTRDPRVATDMQDTVFGLLQNLPRQQIGDLTVAGCWRRSAAYLGVDGNGRHDEVSNWDLQYAHPTLHRN